MLKLGKYQHYRNKNFYQVIGVALNVDTKEKTVIYKALYDIPELEAEYGLTPTFTRAYTTFTETVEFEGKTVPRYRYIGE